LFRSAHAARDRRARERVIELDPAHHRAAARLAHHDRLAADAHRDRVERDPRAVDLDAQALEELERAAADRAGADLVPRVARLLEDGEPGRRGGGQDVQGRRDAGRAAADDDQVEHAAFIAKTWG